MVPKGDIFKLQRLDHRRTLDGVGASGLSTGDSSTSKTLSIAASDRCSSVNDSTICHTGLSR